jgi:hypothetical protein
MDVEKIYEDIGQEVELDDDGNVVESAPEETTETKPETKPIIDELVEGATKEAQASTEKPAEKPAEKAEEKPAAEEAEPTKAELAEAALETTKETDPAMAGVIKDLQGERKKRQELELKIAKLEGKTEGLAAAEKKAEPEGPQTNAEVLVQLREEFKIGPDDALTVSQLEEYENRKAQLAQRKAQQAEDTTKKSMKEMLVAQDAAMAEEFSAEKVGQGKDYRTVTALGKAFLTEADQKQIYSDKENLCRTFYKLCLERLAENHPALKDFYKPSDTTPSKETSAKETPKEKPKKPKNTPIPPGQSPQKAAQIQAEKEADEFEGLAGKTDEQLDEMLKESQAAEEAA